MATLPKKEMFRRTIESLEASCESHPGNRKLLHQLAIAYFKAGHFHPRALQVYEEASNAFPTDAKLQRAVAIGFMTSQGRVLVSDVPSIEDIDPEGLSETIEQLGALAQEYPDSPDIYAAIADIQLIRGEYREAIQRYRSALALGLDHLDGICSHFEAIQEIYALPPNVVAFFAEIYQRLGRMDEANKLYRELVDEGEVDQQTLDAYYSFLTRRIENYQHDPTALNDLIRQICEVSLVMGNNQEALSWARQLQPEALAKSPSLVKKLGRLLIDMEDFRQAFDYLSKIEIDSEAKALLNEIAVLLEQRGELDTAVYLLQFINEHDWISRGSKALLSRGKDDDTGAELIKKKGEDWEIEINTELQLAELHWKNRRWRQAFDAYLHVLELGYEDYRSILEPLDSLLERLPDISEKNLAFLANFFAERRDWRRTLFYSERALFLDPTLDDIRARLIQACEQILLSNPDACEVRLKLGDVALEKGNIERALKEYRKVATYPEFGMKANRRMAVALFRARDYKAAFQKFQNLPVLETEDLEHLYDLMISFQNTEQWKLALESATLIRDYDPGFRDTKAKIEFYQQRVSSVAAEFAVDPKMRELIGDHSIGRYRYLQKIGSGGMGVVHKVIDLKTNVEVAMKILREGLSGSDKAIDRFFREARIAATLHHKNIVNILDYNISNFYGQSYIAMEFVDGPSLRDILEDKFVQTVDVELNYVLEVMDWMMQVCDALDATHRKGIIHRDIKPDNIMLAPSNVIKLTDFGIVHIEEATFTPTGALIGTPRYMSPEQVHGGRIDARSDIYSVGIIMYEMLTGSPPFISGDISYQQVNVLPTNPREICGTIPELLDAIIMKCLEKNPADRYQSALEMRASLEEAFVRIGGNPERLHPSAHDANKQLMAHNDSTMPGSARATRPETPTTVIKQKRPAAPAPAPQSGAWRADDDFDLENDLDLDVDYDEQDRHDRIIRPAGSNPANPMEPLVSTPQPQTPSKIGPVFRGSPKLVNRPTETESPTQDSELEDVDLDMDGGSEAAPEESVPAEDELDELDLDMGSAVESKIPIPFSPSPTDSLPDELDPELDPDIDPAPRKFQNVADLFGEELDLGENAEEAPTMPIKLNSGILRKMNITPAAQFPSMPSKPRKPENKERPAPEPSEKSIPDSFDEDFDSLDEDF